VVHPAVRQGSRWLTPAGFLLVALLFLMPFATVACVPGGYGRTTAAGATTYRGVDLVTGGQPAVTTDHLRPPEQRRDDRVPPQPLAIAVLVLAIGGALATSVAGSARVRRAVGGTIAGAAALLLLASQAVVVGVLVNKVGSQLTEPIPADRQVSDYVQTRHGFWLCLLALGGSAVANLLGWRRLRRPAESHSVEDATTLPTPVDPWATG
jgi:hypothetical protein